MIFFQIQVETEAAEGGYFIEKESTLEPISWALILFAKKFCFLSPKFTKYGKRSKTL